MNCLGVWGSRKVMSFMKVPNRYSTFLVSQHSIDAASVGLLAGLQVVVLAVAGSAVGAMALVAGLEALDAKLVAATIDTAVQTVGAAGHGRGEDAGNQESDEEQGFHFVMRCLIDSDFEVEKK